MFSVAPQYLFLGSNKYNVDVTYNVSVALSHNHCCYGNSTMVLCIIVDLHVAVNNMKPLSVAIDVQRWIPSASLSSYKIFQASFKKYP